MSDGRRRGAEDVPRVSVVLAVRNGERFLDEAIDSVMGQDYRDLELIVIDDGSTDGTGALTKSREGVIYFRQEQGGIAAARNRGIGLARGGLIAFMSHDDLWEPQKLRLQVECLDGDRGLDLVVTRMSLFLEPGCTRPAGSRSEWFDREQDGWVPETMLARRAAFQRVGLFDPSYVVGEDTDWFARARDAGVRTAVVPGALVRKRIHDRNASAEAGPNAHLLLRAMKASLDRKRAQGSGN